MLKNAFIVDKKSIDDRTIKLMAELQQETQKYMKSHPEVSIKEYGEFYANARNVYTTEEMLYFLKKHNKNYKR